MKCLIIGPATQEADRISIIHKIVELDTGITVANMFTTDTSFAANKDANDSYKYNISPVDIDIAFKNTAMAYCCDTCDEAHGIMGEDYCVCDIAQCSFDDFIYIYNTYITETDVVVWAERGHTKSEAASASDGRINEAGAPCMCFNLSKENINDIAHVILNYINADDSERADIIYNNS